METKWRTGLTRKRKKKEENAYSLERNEYTFVGFLKKIRVVGYVRRK